MYLNRWLKGETTEVSDSGIFANVEVEIDGEKYTVVNDDRIEAKQHMLDNYPSLRQMYKADDDNTQVLYLKDATATFYFFGKEPKVVKF